MGGTHDLGTLKDLCDAPTHNRGFVLSGGSNRNDNLIFY